MKAVAPDSARRQPVSVRVPDAIGMRVRDVLPLPAVRLVYRLGHFVMRGVWAVTRPAPEGAKVAALRGDEVLFVRLTYGRRDEWDLPGGTRMEGETPAQTAARELEEETGLRGELAPVGSWHGVGRHGRGLLHGFSVQVADGEEPTIDGAEVAEACWFQRTALPAPLAASTELVLRAALR